jgi:hypothetical protein
VEPDAERWSIAATAHHPMCWLLEATDQSVRARRRECMGQKRTATESELGDIRGPTLVKGVMGNACAPSAGTFRAERASG